MTCEHGQHEEEAYWEDDARGIPLCKVCDACRAERLNMYRPEVLWNPNYTADEDIEPEPLPPTPGLKKLGPGAQRAARSRAKAFYPFD